MGYGPGCFYDPAPSVLHVRTYRKVETRAEPDDISTRTALEVGHPVIEPWTVQSSDTAPTTRDGESEALRIRRNFDQALAATRLRGAATEREPWR